MRILLVGPAHPFKGGIAQHTTALAEYLTDAGHSVDLLSWKSQYPDRLYPGTQELPSPDSESQFSGTRRVLKWWDPISWFRSVHEPVDLAIFAVVNGFQMPAYEVIARKVRRMGGRTTALCHNVVPHESGALHRGIVGRFLRSCDRVVVHSAEEGERARTLGVPQPNVTRMPFHFPVVPEALPPDRPATRGLLVFGFVRRYKGVDLLIEAAALADCGVRITVVGEFWIPMEELEAVAGEFGLAESVELRDAYLEPSEIVDLLQSHDALVLPYRSGTGSQQPEIAQLAGTPVIATAVGDLPERVSDGVDGLVVPPESAERLAEAIRRLYQPGVLQALREGISRPDPAQEWRDYVEVLVEG